MAHRTALRNGRTATRNRRTTVRVTHRTIRVRLSTAGLAIVSLTSASLVFAAFHGHLIVALVGGLLMWKVVFPHVHAVQGGRKNAQKALRGIGWLVAGAALLMAYVDPSAPGGAPLGVSLAVALAVALRLSGRRV